MDWRSRWLIGSHGIDCGRVEVQGDPKAATASALKAQSEGRPFGVRYDIMGYDSAVAGGIVRASTGQISGLSIVGDPSGQGGISLFRQRGEQDSMPTADALVG